MTRALLAAVCLFLAFASAEATEFDPYKGPKPVAVLIQTDRWLAVINSDSPMVAIYEDGQVVYANHTRERLRPFFSKQLDTAELSAIKQQLAAFGDYSKLKGNYSVSSSLDMPSTKLYLSLGDMVFSSTIYGLTISDLDARENLSRSHDGAAWSN